MRRLTTVAWVATALFASSGALADTSTSASASASAKASPYRFSFALDAPLIGLSLAAAGAAFIEAAPPACLPSACEPPAGMNALDRRALGYHSPTAHAAADVAVAALLAAPHLVNHVVTRGEDHAWLEDLVISMQSVLVAQGFTQLTKAAVGRRAPIVYDERVPLEERTSKDALGSFPSGHTATAFAAATSFAVSYWLRNPRDPWRWVVLATLESVALGVGFLKIRAGYHYPTDIFAGAMVGSSAGVLVPMLHRTF